MLDLTLTPPPFVGEITSPDSRTRDLNDTVALYEWLGIESYLVIDAVQLISLLTGERLRDFEAEMQARIVAEQRAQMEAKARQDEAAARQKEEAARQQAETELEKLRAELKRLKGEE